MHLNKWKSVMPASRGFHGVNPENSVATAVPVLLGQGHQLGP